MEQVCDVYGRNTAYGLVMLGDSESEFWILGSAFRALGFELRV